jgi:prepilin-type N-terminal cleavage/methylation domain-containing protein
MTPRPPRTTPTRPRHAFTLFELMLVVCILGIIAAALLPPIGANLYSARLRTAANVLAADIDFCSSECIAQPSAPLAINFDLQNNKYTVIQFGSGTAVKHPADGKDFINDFATGRNAQLSGVTLKSVLSGGVSTTSLTFDAYGRPLLTSDLVITLRFNNVDMVVTVKSTTGDVSITGG